MGWWPHWPLPTPRPRRRRPPRMLVSGIVQGPLPLLVTKQDVQGVRQNLRIPPLRIIKRRLHRTSSICTTNRKHHDKLQKIKWNWNWSSNGLKLTCVNRSCLVISGRGEDTLRKHAANSANGIETYMCWPISFCDLRKHCNAKSSTLPPSGNKCDVDGQETISKIKLDCQPIGPDLVLLFLGEETLRKHAVIR